MRLFLRLFCAAYDLRFDFSFRHDATIRFKKKYEQMAYLYVFSS